MKYLEIDGIRPKTYVNFDNTILKTYYFLPLDSFNQPSGDIQEIKMTLAMFKMDKHLNITPYLFETYYDACKRALN